MAVYTEVSFDTAASLVARLGLGELTSLRGVHAGIENTNYFADTAAGRYVLTVFERLGTDELPFYLHLMQHLAHHGLPVPAPHADLGGALLHTLHGKPAALVDRLPGAHRLAPDAADCAALGTMLARMHRAGADFELHQAHPRGLAWWADTAAVVRPFVDDAQRELVDTELAFQQHLTASAAYATLPRGVVHADLFRDNVMFDDYGGGDTSAPPRITGLFDFYFAGIDVLLFDLAVCLNDWCIDLDTGRLDAQRARALVDAYDATRALTGGERRLLPALMRGAALRFWLSRLADLHRPRDATLLTAHDPGHFERVLRERIAEPWHPGTPDPLADPP
ncbi:MAG TPA: homoserine kinase [Burkholderiaceae bacterium]|nr:homoserine kinase [Burkholderiaceae bacterium]